MPSMTVQVRPVRVEELPGWIDAMRTAFLSVPDAAATQALATYRLAHAGVERTWGGFDADRCVATLRSTPFPLTVPGGARLTADGLTNVTVAATHRRRGLLTGMLTESLRTAVDRGDPVAVLIAAEWPIYGRFGYGPATDAVSWQVDATAGTVRVPQAGTVARVEPAELAELAPPVIERWSRGQPGALVRPPHRLRHDLGLAHPEGQPPDWRGICVVHADPAGEPDGYLLYHVDEAWRDGNRPNGTLHVDELVTSADGAYADLWRYCCEHDWVATVRAPRRRPDEPLPWLLTDPRAAWQAARTDYLWLRLLDVPAALSARTYSRPGRCVLEVVDGFGHAAGRFALDAGPDGASCGRTGAAADVTLPAWVLGAVYLGGTRLRTLAAAGLVDEHRPGALAAADALLAGDVTPWCSIDF